jgi:uncharacterized protein with GYD domain
MPRYMLQFAYTAQTWATLAKNPTDRRPALRAALEKLGAKLIDLYYHFGDYDGVAIVDAPDDTAATAAVIAVTAPGHLRATKTTRLMSVEEVLDAMKRAGTVPYQAPSAR